jgi:replicative DNA helicase
MSLPDLPNDIDAERAVLGAPFVSASALDALADLDADDFMQPVHREIFGALMAIRKKGDAPDWLVVADLLKPTGALARMEGGARYLVTLANSCPAAYSAESYARIVKEMAVRRRLIVACADLSSQAQRGDADLGELLDDARRRVADLGTTGAGKWQTMEDLVPQVLYDLEERQKRFADTGEKILGIRFGIERLDNIILGAQPGDLGIIAADTSAGKTALAMQAVILELLAGGTALVVNMEMPAKQLVERALIHLARLDSRAVRYGNFEYADWKRLHGLAGQLMESSCVVKDDINTMAQICASGRRWRARNPSKRGIMVVDFAQLIRGTDRRLSRAQEVGTFAQDLKSLAKELDVAEVLISQLNRSGAKSERPSKSDLKESGDLENAADWIIIVHNKADKPCGDDPLAFYVDKNRNGAKAQATGWFTGKHYLITDDRPGE